MKISGTRPASPVGRINTGRGGKQGAASVSAPREISDTTSIMGIPEAELTPKVRAAIMTLMEEVGRLRQEVENAQRRLEELENYADQDPLIPVFNRRAFVRELSRIKSFSERYNATASLVYIDLNDFKQINDRYGHAGGDAALAHVAGVLRANIRESDIIGRLGGDEFGVILVHADENVARDKAQSLVTALEKTPFEWEGAKIPIRAAHGVYTIKPGVEIATALDEADKAMYARKAQMRGKQD